MRGILPDSTNLPKPQLQFSRPQQTARGFVWKPILKEKPHAIETLDPASILHPYAAEIARLPEHLPEHLSKTPEVSTSKATVSSMKTKPFTYVDSLEKLLEMCQVLREAKEIAVDLEHHDLRTFLGIVCLVQVSNRGLMIQIS